jgi:hypothetical protein
MNAYPNKQLKDKKLNYTQATASPRDFYIKRHSDFDFGRTNYGELCASDRFGDYSIHESQRELGRTPLRSMAKPSFQVFCKVNTKESRSGCSSVQRSSIEEDLNLKSGFEQRKKNVIQGPLSSKKLSTELLPKPEL